MKAYLLLANGMVFEGRAFGAAGTSVGEVVFNTGMVGYEEILTDPSYYGQIITQTYPLVGNYGVNGEDAESARIWAFGYIVRELCGTPSNFRCQKTLDEFLKEQGIIGIAGVDTRRLTRIIRESGVMNGALTTEYKSADAVRAEGATTAYNSSSPTGAYKQDGYAEGTLSTIGINPDGTVVGRYSNGQGQNLWQIPVCRFTSEDGLRREGSNLFSATEEAGQMEMGVAGTENYGTVNAYNVENSNVDMATEMVNMIITQRGFQSNSKVVTTADQMLQKAMELKR